MSNVDARTEELFNELAEAQRGAPEEAGARIQDTQISQLYGETAEHVGDLTHRMSQSVNFFHGGYEWVREKVEKTLRWLTNPFGFVREMLEQINSNFNYHLKRGNLPVQFGGSPEEALANLKRLGREYADEHAKLTVYNDVQQIAQGAAIAIGKMKFDVAIRLLGLLKRVLDKGEKAWAREAMKTSFGSSIHEESPSGGEHFPEKCFACGKKLGANPAKADTRDAQTVYVGRECLKKIQQAGEEGYRPPKGGPRLYLLGEL